MAGKLDTEMRQQFYMLEFRCDSMNSVARKVCAYKSVKQALTGVAQRFGYNGGKDQMLSVYKADNMCGAGGAKPGSLIARRHGNNSNKSDWQMTSFFEV